MLRKDTDNYLHKKINAFRDTRLPRVLMLIPQLGYGGAEGSFLRIAMFLSQHVTVTFCLMSADYGKVGYTVAEIKHDFPVWMLSTTAERQTGFISKLWRWFRMLLRLRKIKNNHDVVISFLSGANFLNSLAGFKAKTIISVRGSRVFDDSAGWLKRFLWRDILDRFSYSRASRIVCASSGLRDEVIGMFPCFLGRTLAIEGTVDSVALLSAADDPVEHELESLLSFPTIVTYGRFHRAKGFDFLIRVFGKLRLEVPNAKLLIIGDGPEAENLFNLVRRLDLKMGTEVRPANYDLFFIGYRKTPHRYLRFGKVFVFPSRYEGLPNTLIEALSTGVPILAADCPWGVRSILGSHDRAIGEKRTSTPYKLFHGALMPTPEDAGAEDAWVQALHQILTHSPERLTKDQCRKAIRRFDIESTGPQWLKLIQEVVASRSNIR
jgi:glycosyltransferase involved in cell wall biosynthesis